MNLRDRMMSQYLGSIACTWLKWRIRRNATAVSSCTLLLRVAHASLHRPDVVASIKTLINSPQDQLTVEERNLLSIAFKNLTAQLRNQWRTIDTLEKRAASRSLPQQVALMHLQKERIRRELESTCMEIIELLEKFLIQSANPGEEKVFYSKM